MGIYQTDGDRLGNLRISLQLAHERNKELASYIRLTDAAILGFLGLAFVQLFNNNFWLFSFNIPIFLTLVIISMWLWRLQVRKYQNDIEEGYQTILYCENNLEIPDEISLQSKLIKKSFHDLSSVSNKEIQYKELIKKFQTNQYTDENHLKINKLATQIKWVAIILLISWTMCFLFFLHFILIC
jgi:hypothetical protein